MLGLTFAALGSVAQAGVIREYYRGTRAMGMGGAFIAVADDEQALFLNPAGLAGIEQASFHYAAVDIASTYDAALYALSNLGNLGSTDGMMTLLEDAVGKNIFAQTQFTPTLIAPNFGAAIIMDAQATLNQENKVAPDTIFQLQQTNGVQVGYGIAIGRGKKSRGELRIGIGAKVLWRRGGYRDISLMDLYGADAQFLTRHTGGWGMGYGGDLGMQYILNLSKRMRLMAGTVYTNLGDVNFGTGSPAPDSVKGNWGIGFAAQYKMRDTKITVAYDYTSLLQETDWRKKNHMGLEIALPFLTLLGGINQTYISFGAAMNLWIMRITASSFGVENGSFAFQDGERRYQLRIDLKFDL